jgi:hypothetical protein
VKDYFQVSNIAIKEHPMPTKWNLGRLEKGFDVLVKGVCLMEVASAPWTLHPGKI